MSLFNEQDDEPLKWEVKEAELTAMQENRARLVSEDIFKEIDEQVFDEQKPKQV